MSNRWFLKLICVTALFSIYELANASPEQHTNWCFQGDTDNRLIDQPQDRGNCAALLVGGALASYFSDNAELANIVLNSRQNQWAQQAANFSCLGGFQNNQYAIRLIQACQCHNTGAQQSIENNQTEVLNALKIKGGCATTKSGSSQPNPPPPPPPPPPPHNIVPNGCTGQATNQGGWFSCPEDSLANDDEIFRDPTLKEECASPPTPIISKRATKEQRAQKWKSLDDEYQKMCSEAGYHFERRTEHYTP